MKSTGAAPRPTCLVFELSGEDGEWRAALDYRNLRFRLCQWWTQAPEPIRRLLLTDPDPTVRHVVETHRRLPVRELTQLLADPSEWVATAAAGHPGLPPEHMQRLLSLAGL